jgi:hypothetical protein
LGFLRGRNTQKFTVNGAPVGPSITPHPSVRRARHENGKGTVCVRAGTSKNRKNTEFAIILEMDLREAYPHRALAVFAYGALTGTHTKHLAALGPKLM